MKVFCFLLFLFSFFHGQTQTTNFFFEEIQLDGEIVTWKTNKIREYSIIIDSTAFHSGRRSLKIKSTSENDSMKSGYFSQTMKINYEKAQKITINAFIRTENVHGKAGLWCRVLDEKDELIWYEDFFMQGKVIEGTKGWKMYSLPLLVDNKAKKLIFGGELRGKGAVWYDDFTVISNKKGSKPPMSIEKYIKHLKKTVKNNSIYSDSLDWKKIHQELQILSEGMEGLEDAPVLANYLLNKLREKGDNHSFLMNKIMTNAAFESNTDEGEPYAKMLDSNTAYLYIPGVSTLNDSILLNFAYKIQVLIKDLDSKYLIKTWVVDLRENTGGNMYPMIAGIGPLIGDGLAGYFISPKKEEKWFYKNGASWEDARLQVKIKQPYYLKNINIKIAVLIGENTASSGEMTAISFIGKSNVKLFGQETAGYITANEGYPLLDGSNLYLAVARVADRNKKIYLDGIKPDVRIDESADEIQVFNVIKEWLNE